MSKAPERTVIPHIRRDGLRDVAWHIAADCGLKWKPLRDVLLSVYISGLQHGHETTMAILAAEKGAEK